LGETVVGTGATTATVATAAGCGGTDVG
jgi:hypothetical protein